VCLAGAFDGRLQRLIGARGRIISIQQVGNLASARIMEKLEMHFERRTVDPSCGRPVNVYQITRTDRSRA